MKKNILALVALLVLGVAVWFVVGEKAEKEPAIAEVSLPLPIDVSRIDKLEILRHEGSGSTLREEVIVLVQKDGEWHITQPVVYKAHQELIEMMLESMKGIKLIDTITDNKAKHRALEVDDDFGIVVKAMSGGQEVIHFIVGVTQGEITFVRIPGSDTVFRTTGSYRNRFNKSTSKLRHKYIMEIEDRSVSRAKFINDKGTLEMVRTGEGDAATFEPKGIKIQNFDAKRAKMSLLSIPKIIARDFVDHEISDEVSGLGEGAAILEFDAIAAGQEKTITIRLGNENKKMRQTYVKTSESDQIFLVSTHLIARYRLSTEDFARTDEQVRKQIEAEKKAAEHGEHHHHGRKQAQQHDHDHEQGDGHEH